MKEVVTVITVAYLVYFAIALAYSAHQVRAKNLNAGKVKFTVEVKQSALIAITVCVTWLFFYFS